MDIGWFRDQVICIWGLVGAIVLIFIAVIVFKLYRKSRAILNNVTEATSQGKHILTSVESSASVVKNIVSKVDQEMLGPAIQIASVIQGIRYGVTIFNKIFGSRKGGDNDE